MCAVTEEQIKKLFSYDIEAEKHAINMMLSGNDQEISSALQNRINLDVPFCGICAKVGRGECQKHQKPNLLQEPRIQEDGAVR